MNTCLAPDYFDNARVAARVETNLAELVTVPSRAARDELVCGGSTSRCRRRLQRGSLRELLGSDAETRPSAAGVSVSMDDARDALCGDHHATSDRTSRAPTRTCRAPCPTPGPAARRVALWTWCPRPSPPTASVSRLRDPGAGHGARSSHRLCDPEAPRARCAAAERPCVTFVARRTRTVEFSAAVIAHAPPQHHRGVVARAREMVRAKLRNQHASSLRSRRGAWLDLQLESEQCSRPTDVTPLCKLGRFAS